ncbi:uncharacterized protein UTRI_00641 [Ustilago trichophora]|uniref:DNA replication regulator SLD2 n=1 Tax=Ustilago trichophora TaxID=86804 RepID=A0A5C3DRV0_9BASI|nr:uncharacterized protein UTRI_00641 [Ustilago trichophora]
MEQVLRRELKSWQKAFKAQHGRDPTKRDILADATIAGAYDTWMAVGGDAKAKARPKTKYTESSVRSTGASTSRHKLDDSQEKEEVFRTPSKKKSHRMESSASPSSRNPFRTPTKKSSPYHSSSSSSAAAAIVTPGKTRNPFASPSKPTAPPSPAGSMIEVEMTPNKPSPSHRISTFIQRNNFTPTKSPSSLQYITSSPSKLRTTLSTTSATAGVRRTPTKNQRTSSSSSDAALNAALVAYTPRTRARKRLRGEDVPPTPRRREGKDGVARTDPRPVQKGLGAFGFASSRKAGDGVAGNSSVFARTLSSTKTSRGEEMEEEEEEEEVMSPIKAVAKLRRTASAKPGFRPLFASPSGNHAPKDVLGTSSNSNTANIRAILPEEVEQDADALMDDDTNSPAGGLFAAEVQQRRLRRAREGSFETDAKKLKTRPAPHLPAPSNSSDDDEATPIYQASSSPAYRHSLTFSSPHTEMTIPSSTGREANVSKPRGISLASSPLGKVNRNSESKVVRGFGGVKVQEVELSDDEFEARYTAPNGNSVMNGQGKKKIISINPYQRYGTLRASFTSSPFQSSDPISSDEDDDTEDQFSQYPFPIPSKHNVYANDPTLTTIHSSSDSQDDHDQPSLARLKLSPVRHAPSSQRKKQHQLQLLNNIFDPTAARNAASKPKLFNPEPRFGPLQPSNSDLSPDQHDDQHQHPSHKLGKNDTATGADSSDDDDDWQQEVDEDFTFLDSEIELQDVA